MKRKSIITLASVLIFTSFMYSNDVSASSGNKLELSTVDTELESGSQEHVKGTAEQLKKVNKDAMDLVKDIGFDTHVSGNDYGLYPSVTLAQAILESRNGNSGLSKAPYHNLFGVKGYYNGSSVQMLTKEDDGSGRLYSIYANFKSYPDRKSALRDHDRLIREGLSGFYSGTWRENAKTPAHAAKVLEGRYATDTSYASKLVTIINDYNLERFDEKLTDRDLAWLSSKSIDPFELPIVEDFKADKVQTWGSGLEDSIKINREVEVNETVESYNKYYIEDYLGLTKDFSDSKNPRFKRDPESGDIAVYKIENSDNELVERYGIVEGVRIDSLLISEGIKGSSGLHAIYRSIPNSSLYKFEFINSAKLEGYANSQEKKVKSKLGKIVKVN